jgi:alkylated DNA nucleotide flippase Atl1
MNRAVDQKSLADLGFRSSVGSVHLSRTIMLQELSLTLDGVPSHAPASRYREAIVEENLLGKATRSTRLKTTEHLIALYSLDPRFALFRLLRTFWETEQSGKAMLALLAATGRDTLLRESTDVILAVPPGSVVSASEIAQALGERYPARFAPTTLQATAQRLASSWAQAGYLTGKVAKQRSQPVVTPQVAAYALVMGYLYGMRGKLLLGSAWARLLDRTPAEVLELATEASKQGWLRLKAAGAVVEINFPGLLTPAEERLSNEQD